MKVKFLKDYQFIGNYPGDGSDTTVHTGDVIDLEHTESAKWLINNGFAEEVKESGWWKPGTGGRYYYVNDDGEIIEKPWLPFGSPTDEKRFIMGNCFRSNVAVERYRDYLKAIATVRQDEGVLTPEQAAKNGYIYYICTHKESGLVVHGFNYVSVNTVLFDTREHAQASLDNHPDEWKIIANYDWSRE